MNQVKQIIQSVLDEHRGTCENDELAAKCTAKLTEATIKEVASLLGGVVGTVDGCAAIYTDFEIGKENHKIDTSHIGA